MMIGAGGVGKSSFLKGLMNKRLPQHAESTILADTKTVKPFWAKAGESVDGYWAEVTEEDEIQELAGLVQLVAQVKSDHSKPSRAAKILSTMAAAAAVGVFYPLGFIPHKVQTKGDKYVSSIKNGVVRNVLEQALQRAENSPGNPSVPESEVLMHVWDCGGQPVFLDVLPAFLTSRTMFLIFFDARSDLLRNCKTLTHKQGRVVGTTEEGFTVRQLLMQWMACIHVTLSRENVAVGSSNESAPQSSVKEFHPDSSPQLYQEKSFSPPHKKHCPEKKTCGSIISDFPRIIPVGTHGDDAAVKRKKSNILDTLKSHCEDKAFAHLLLNGVVVDNTTAGTKHEDPGFKTIREEVHKFANKNLAIPTPVAWVLFRKVLQKVAKDNPIVPYEQAVAVGEACGIVENVVPSVLHFYHELAVFLHYTQIKNLSQYIITDPQWLIKQFGKLLSPKEFQQKVSNQALWKPLQEKGILVQPLYEEVWKGSSLQPQQLTDLLEHFCLAALIEPQQKVTRFPGQEYFIPSVLPSSSSTTDNVTKFVKKSSPLHLTFSTLYVPPGFFTRLATTLTKKSKCHLLIARGVFRNKMTFAYGEVDKIDEFTIFEHSSSIQIIVVRTEYRESHIPTFGSVCHDVMKLIQACFAVTYQWFPSVKVDAALQCEHCADFVLLLPDATTNSILLCQAGHTCRFTGDQRYWMKVPNTPEYLARMGDFTDVELKGVADDVQRAGKLKELADALEVVPFLKSLEGDINAPLTLLRRWRSGMESGLDAHSLLVHHLKCIGLTKTSDRLHHREFILHSDPSNETNTSVGTFEDARDPLSLTDIVTCSRCIDGDLTLLAAVLDIPDEEVATIKSKFKAVQGQTYHMLQKWHSSGTHTKQELAEILKGAGFPQAASILMTSQDTMSTAQQKPELRDLISEVKTTEWYHLGLQLNLDNFKLDQIQVDARRNQEHLTLMFEAWLRVSENPSWQDVIRALKAIGERRVAAELQQKFCK